MAKPEKMGFGEQFFKKSLQAEEHLLLYVGVNYIWTGKDRNPVSETIKQCIYPALILEQPTRNTNFITSILSIKYILMFLFLYCDGGRKTKE